MLNSTEAENGTFLIVFRMMCASACGGSCSACGESFPHAETRVPRAEILFRVWRNVSACGDSCSMCRRPCGAGVPRAETRFPRHFPRNVSACGDSCSACGRQSPHAEIGAETCFQGAETLFCVQRNLRRFVFCVPSPMLRKRSFI